VARPTKLTPEVQKRITDAISTGVPREAAAAAAGIGETTLYRWLQLGQEGKAPYREFWEDLTRADYEYEAALVRQANRHAITDSRMCQWLLARKFPQRWGDVVKHEVRFAGMTDLELDAYLAEAERALAEAGPRGAGAAGAPAAADGAGD
jgi:transposase-like protein